MDVSSYLDQSDIWIATDGTEVKVSEMSTDHASLSARWLQENATGLILVVEASINEGAIAGEGHVRGVLELIATSPRRWIASTPLYQALIKVSGEQTSNGSGGPGNYVGRKDRFN